MKIDWKQMRKTTHKERGFEMKFVRCGDGDKKDFLIPISEVAEIHNLFDGDRDDYIITKSGECYTVQSEDGTCCSIYTAIYDL